MRHEIIVSNPGSDAMGASFRSLLEVLDQLEVVKTNDKLILDLSNLSFIHPFLILPICSLMAKVEQNNISAAIRYGVATESYLETI